MKVSIPVHYQVKYYVEKKHLQEQFQFLVAIWQFHQEWPIYWFLLKCGHVIEIYLVSIVIHDCVVDFSMRSAMHYFALTLCRFSQQMCELFTEVFQLLPLCHCINNKVLVSIVTSIVCRILFYKAPYVESTSFSDTFDLSGYLIVHTNPLNVPLCYFIVRVPSNVLEFHLMFLNVL